MRENRQERQYALFLRNFGISLLSVGAAASLTSLISPLAHRTPFTLFYAAVIVSTWYGGLRLGLMATLLSALAGAYLFLPPNLGLSSSAESLIPMSMFLLVAMLTNSLTASRKRAEELAREQREWLQVTLSSIGDAVIATDRQGKVVFLNPVAAALTGWQPAEAIGQPLAKVFNIINEATQRPVENPVERVLLEGSLIGLTSQTLLIAKDGTTRPIDDSGAPIRNNKGQIIGVVLVFHDVTERRQAEQTLRQSEERYRAFVAQSTEGIWRVELEQPVSVDLPADDQIEHFYRYAYLAECNDVMARMYGFASTEEIVGTRLGDLLIRSDPRNLDYLRAFIESSYRLRDAESHELDRAGQSKYFINSLVGTVENGFLLRAWGTQVDITERKQTQEALQESERRFRQLAENIREVFWMSDLKKPEMLYISPAYEEIWGRSCQSLYDQPSSFLEAIHLEDRALVIAALDRQGRGHKTAEEYRVVRPDGTIRWIWDRAFPIRDEAGQVYRVAGIAEDITEHKRAELALQASEERYRLIMENVEDYAIFTMDMSGRVTSWNIGAEQILGYREAEIIGREGRVIFTPEDLGRGVPEQELLQAATQGRATDERWHVRQNGRRFWGSGVVTPLREADGKLRGYVKIMRDYTARKQSEEERAELLRREQAARAQAEAAERRSAFLAEASTVLASSLDYEATLSRLTNLAIPVLADWCAVDMLEDDGSIRRLAVAHQDPAKVDLAHELWRRYPPDPNNPEGLPKVLRTGEAQLYTDISDSLLIAVARNEEHLRQLRELGFQSAMIVPLIAQGRTLGGITFVTAESGYHYGQADLWFATDLARRAALAIDNARLYRTAQQANRLKDEFLATVSHELRTPLTAILGWTHILRTGNLDEATFARALETIDRNAKAQAQLVNDLLEVSRIITGKLRLETQAVELPAVIEAALETIRPAAEAKNIALQVTLTQPGSLVLGDAGRLQQVVWNLVSNAIKFTPPGGHITVQLAPVGTHAEVTVSDTGQGIKPEFLPHIFERFRQADASSTRQHGGLGLGLAIVRHLVELHGGAVQAESPGEDQGATFKVLLPLAFGGAPGAEPAPRQAATPTHKLIDRWALLAGVRVLLVEDEDDTREALVNILQRCGCEVVATVSAAEALKAFKQLRPDVLISDIGMPNEDGYSLIRTIRELILEEGGDTPAIALPAYARSEDRDRALAAGFQLHLAKPVDPNELAAALAKLAVRRDLPV